MPETKEQTWFGTWRNRIASRRNATIGGVDRHGKTIIEAGLEREREADTAAAEANMALMRELIDFHPSSDPGAAAEPEQSWRPAGFRVVGSKIHRPGEPIYMVRWVLVRLFGWELRINNFMDSDADCLHDHPAAFVSLIVAGWYREITPERVRIYKAGSILFRPAKWKHRIEIEGPCLSINLVGPRTRNWGFWTLSGWMPWQKYNQGKHRC